MSGKAVQRRQLALLAVLGAGGEAGWTRDKLVGLLWPENDQEGARHRLSGSLYELRKALGDDVVLVTGESLRLNRELISTDVGVFEAELEREDLSSAVDSYGGPFLDGFYLGGSSEFDAWVESERKRLRGGYEKALEELADQAEAAGDHPKAVVRWQRLTASDPYNSRFVLRWMQAMAAAGDPANAIQCAQEHERFLRAELQMELPPDVVTLAEQLREAPPAVAFTPDDESAPPPAVRIRADAGAEHAGSEIAGARRFRRLGRIPLAGAVSAGVFSVVIASYVVIRVLGPGSADSVTRSAELNPRDQIILADLENHTGDSTLAFVIADLFEIDLSQSSSVSLVDPAAELWRMQRDPAGPLDLDLAREVATRMGLKAVLSAGIGTAGGVYSVSVRLVAAETGEELLADREMASDSTEIIPATDRLSKRLREGIGESLVSIRASLPLWRAASPSLPALRKFTLGGRALRAGERDRALALWEEAVAIDTGFAAVYRMLGVHYFNAGDLGRSRYALTKAFYHRDRLTEGARYLVEGTYYQVVGELDEAIIAYGNLLDLDPTHFRALGNLAQTYGDAGEYAQAIELLRRFLDVYPNTGNTFPYRNLARWHVSLDEFTEARAVLERGRERRPDSGWIVDRSIALHAARGDYDSAEAEALQWIAEPGGLLRPRRTAYYWLACLAQVRGKLADAERFWREEMAFKMRQGEDAMFLSNAMRFSKMNILLRADPERGLRVIEETLDRYPLDSIASFSQPYLGDELESEGLVVVYALAGKPNRARALLADHESAVAPEVRRGEKFNLHGATGLVLLAEGNPLEAVSELLLWDPSSGRRTNPNQHLGRAYDLAGRPDEAIEYYERFLNTNDIWRLSLDAAYLASTYERLGQLYEERGDSANAVHYYGKLVDLWDSADPELQPRVEAARQAVRALSPAG